MDPRTIESQVLSWHEAGWMQYRGTARDMLLSLPRHHPIPDSA